MKKRALIAAVFSLVLFISQTGFAEHCPDPEKSSLSWGVPPKPWVVNPFSENSPQGEAGTVFVNANVLVTSGLGQGISCTYKNSLGLYSIWWPVPSKIPSRNDNRWIDTPSGYVCTQSLFACEFHVAD